MPTAKRQPFALPDWDAHTGVAVIVMGTLGFLWAVKRGFRPRVSV